MLLFQLMLHHWQENGFWQLSTQHTLRYLSCCTYELSIQKRYISNQVFFGFIVLNISLTRQIIQRRSLPGYPDTVWLYWRDSSIGRRWSSMWLSWRDSSLGRRWNSTRWSSGCKTFPWTWGHMPRWCPPGSGWQESTVFVLFPELTSCHHSASSSVLLYHRTLGLKHLLSCFMYWNTAIITARAPVCPAHVPVDRRGDDYYFLQCFHLIRSCWSTTESSCEC